MQPLNLVEDLRVKVITYKRKGSLKNNFILIIINLKHIAKNYKQLKKGGNKRKHNKQLNAT
jgi:hypothetical protein